MLAHKFTNAFRASDRVTQYLLSRVIDEGFSARDTFFRIVLFKLFNRISTWELLERELGRLVEGTFRVGRYARVLDSAMAVGCRLYSAAYIMPMAPGFAAERKHLSHLSLLAQMMSSGAAERVADARTMEGSYAALRAYPMMGPFLAYQYVTDLNYSNLTSFSEMEFVVPGPGARNGLSKCFVSLGELSESDAIRWVADRQELELDRLGLPALTLWGRRLQLIDCQNLFCEVDKYARVAHPAASGSSGRTRIKQRYRIDAEPLPYVYPSKWGIRVPPATSIPS
jgi:hypothetical protein